MRRTRDQKLDGAYFAVRRRNGKLAYWVEIPFADGWIAAQRVAAQDGGMVVSELRVFPLERPRGEAGEWSGMADAPKGGVSTPLLRHIPAGRHAVAPVVTDWVEAVLLRKKDRQGVALDWPSRARTRARRVVRDLGLRGEPTPAPQPPTSGRGRPGRRPSRDRRFYETIAADYRRWSGRFPARRIAEKWKVSPATARTWIYAARHKLGLLPKTEPGKGLRFPDSTQPRQRRTRKGKGR